MEKDAKIFVAGHRGLVGSAIVRKLQAAGYQDLCLRTRAELDLMDRNAVDAFFAAERPDYVFLAAAKVGGILANSRAKADFLFENLEIQQSVIRAAWKHGAKKLLFLGSSCIYPKLCRQPIREEYLLSGPLEETNEAYAIAKIAGIKLCQCLNEQYGTDFIAAMPTNLYGPHDNFDLESSHVLPALIRRFHEARASGQGSVRLWGTGSPRREFLHVDDLASALLLLMERHSGSQIINVGTGEDVRIQELALLVKAITGYEGAIEWDSGKPDGTPRKLLDVSRLEAYGWAPSYTLEEGIRHTYEWFQKNA